MRVAVDTGAVQDIPFRAQVELGLGPLLRQSLHDESGPVRARLVQEPRAIARRQQLAFSALGRVYVMSLRAGAAPRRLAGDGPPEYQPAWSQDGRSIAYVTWTSAGGASGWPMRRRGARAE